MQSTHSGDVLHGGATAGAQYGDGIDRKVWCPAQGDVKYLVKTDGV